MLRQKNKHIVSLTSCLSELLTLALMVIQDIVGHFFPLVSVCGSDSWASRCLVMPCYMGLYYTIMSATSLSVHRFKMNSVANRL